MLGNSTDIVVNCIMFVQFCFDHCADL